MVFLVRGVWFDFLINPYTPAIKRALVQDYIYIWNTGGEFSDVVPIFTALCFFVE